MEKKKTLKKKAYAFEQKEIEEYLQQFLDIYPYFM